MLYQLSYGRTAAGKLGRRWCSVKQSLPVPCGRAAVNNGKNLLLGTVTGESDDDHVILLRVLQRTQDGVARHYAVGCVLIDQTPRGQPINGVGTRGTTGKCGDRTYHVPGGRYYDRVRIEA